MESMKVLEILGKKKKIILKSTGNNIPNAVAVANIITEKMLKGNSHVQKINLDTVSAAGMLLPVDFKIIFFFFPNISNTSMADSITG